MEPVLFPSKLQEIVLDELKYYVYPFPGNMYLRIVAIAS